MVIKQVNSIMREIPHQVELGKFILHEVTYTLDPERQIFYVLAYTCILGANKKIIRL